jgi:hypothetical protein
MDAKKGDWVQIHIVVLKPGERSEKVPEDTQKVPLELRAKGFIERDANKGEQVDIITYTGRKLNGTLVAINPEYGHDFGRPVPELVNIGRELRQILQE